MTRFILPALLALAIAAPATAQDDVSPELAEKRLRACLVTGSSAAPRTALREAVISVRAFCAPQIKRVQEDRVESATAGLTGQIYEDAEDRTVRALNDEIAFAIANFTGLTL